MLTDCLLQILKSFAPVVLVLVLYFAKLEKFNLLLATSMLLITLGSLGAVHGELRFSTFGFWMVTARHRRQRLSSIAECYLKAQSSPSQSSHFSCSYLPASFCYLLMIARNLSQLIEPKSCVQLI